MTQQHEIAYEHITTILPFQARRTGPSSRLDENASYAEKYLKATLDQLAGNAKTRGSTVLLDMTAIAESLFSSVKFSKASHVVMEGFYRNCVIEICKLVTANVPELADYAIDATIDNPEIRISFMDDADKHLDATIALKAIHAQHANLSLAIHTYISGLVAQRAQWEADA